MITEVQDHPFPTNTICTLKEPSFTCRSKTHRRGMPKDSTPRALALRLVHSKPAASCLSHFGCSCWLPWRSLSQ